MIFALGSMGKKNTVLSSDQILTSKYQSIVDNTVKIECTSDVVDVMEYSTLNHYIVLYVGSMRLFPECP